MPRIVQFRRGTDAQVMAATPAAGEIMVNLDRNTLHVGDGVTLGGFALISEAQDQGQITSIQTLETEMDAAEARLDTAESELIAHDARVTVLETNNIWESANDVKYLSQSDGMTGLQIQNLVTNEITNFDASLSSIYRLQTDSYSKLETESTIDARVLQWMNDNLDLSDYRTVLDSYSAAEIDTKFTNLALTYYSRAESDSKFRQIADSYSISEVDAEFADVRNNTYTKAEVDGSIQSVRDDHVAKTDPLMNLAKKVDITETPTEVIFDFCKMGY